MRIIPSIYCIQEFHTTSCMPMVTNSNSHALVSMNYDSYNRINSQFNIQYVTIRKSIMHQLWQYFIAFLVSPAEMYHCLQFLSHTTWYKIYMQLYLCVIDVFTCDSTYWCCSFKVLSYQNAMACMMVTWQAPQSYLVKQCSSKPSYCTLLERWLVCHSQCLKLQPPCHHASILTNRLQHRHSVAQPSFQNTCSTQNHYEVLTENIILMSLVWILLHNNNISIWFDHFIWPSN